MIKILKVGEVKNEEIFARTIPTDSVEDAVSNIIATVRKDGDVKYRVQRQVLVRPHDRGIRGRNLASG